MYEMYENLPLAEQADFATTYSYWSSSEGNGGNDSVQVVYFIDNPGYSIIPGDVRYLQKASNGYVRPIRAF